MCAFGAVHGGLLLIYLSNADGPLKGLNWDPLKEQINELMSVWGRFSITVNSPSRVTSRPTCWGITLGRI